MALTGTTGLQVDGIGVTRVKEWHGRRSRECVDSIQERLVVQVIERAIRLSRFVCGAEQDGPTDELVLDGAGTQTPALRLDLMRQTDGGKERTGTRIVVSVDVGGEANRIRDQKPAPGKSLSRLTTACVLSFPA